MKIGDRVLAQVNNGSWQPCQIIAIKGDIVIVSGDEEQRRVRQSGRCPVGVGLHRHMVRENNVVKPLDNA
jgi:urease beta subunit